MIQRLRGDRGQAFPIYIVMVAGLLFLALAFFTVGKASATRNGAQGAADAAALAAAQEARDEMGAGFLAALLLPGGLNDFFDNNGRFTDPGPCAQAQVLAAKNRADVQSIDGAGSGCYSRPGFLSDEFTVEVKTRYTVGESVIPGTDQKHATARAKAVVEFRCSLPRPEPEPEGSASPGGGGDDGKDEDEKPSPIDFTCHGGRHVTIDPAHPGEWLNLSETFFTVHLVDAD
ncbi:pilus assembly protein TadG-related protein [Streptomyces sp. NPDC093085]|uniref:pilus assembly protein TadG-related protein n=1 Tax=Streptomyces sp. NPDC093085 TaxID=3155068 RepID=UPI00343EF167